MELKNAYCINLKKRPERWDLMRKEIEKFPVGFQLIRFDAVSHINPRVGCAQSHLNLIRLAKEKKWEFIFVIEDDAQFYENTYPILMDCFRKLPEHWDILFGGIYDSHPGKCIDHYLYQNVYLQGTHCLIYNHCSYDKLLSYSGVPLSWDDWLSYLGVTRQITMYHIHPRVAEQRAGFSDIKLEQFNWNEEKHNMKRDYLLQYRVYEGLHENNLDASYHNAQQIEDSYTRDQALKVIKRFEFDFKLKQTAPI